MIPDATEICLRIGSLTLSEHTSQSWSGRVLERRQPASRFRCALFTASSPEGLLLAVVKNPGIVVHDLHHSSPTVSLLNEAYPMSVQKMMRHQHHATTETHAEKVQRKRGGGRHADLGT